MSGGVEVQFPGDTILSDPHRRRPQILYLPSRTPRRRPTSKTTPLVQLVSPSELDCALRQSPRPLVLDCRPTLAFGRGHVTGAAQLRCADRMSRRRLQMGRLSLCDLLSDEWAKGKLKACSKGGAEVILYDEGTTEADQVTEDHPLSPVVASIRDMGARPLLLRGGWREISRSQSASCLVSMPDPPPECHSPSHEEDPSCVGPSAILPFLYVGSARDAENHIGLHALGIGYVLNVTSHVPGLEESGFKFLRLPANDSHQQNLKQYFQKAFAFIDEACQRNSAVLVHCQAGVSRSATIAIGYLMHHTGLSAMEAYRFVKGRRPVIAPNLHFMGQLLELEQQTSCCPTS